MDAAAECRFDLSQIGEADRHNLCVTFLEAALRFYDDPANRERFEIWLKNQPQNSEETQI